LFDDLGQRAGSSGKHRLSMREGFYADAPERLGPERRDDKNVDLCIERRRIGPAQELGAITRKKGRNTLEVVARPVAGDHVAERSILPKTGRGASQRLHPFVWRDDADIAHGDKLVLWRRRL